MESPWRARVAFVLVLPLTPIALAPAGSVSEADAIRLFLEESPQAKRPSSIVDFHVAASRVETRIANPDVAYQIEDAGGVRDEFLTLEQELPITGLRSLLVKRQAAASVAAGLVAGHEIQADVHALRALFYDVLYREETLRTLRRGAADLERTVEILERREREGEGSGYDLLRAGQALGEVRIALLQADAARIEVRARFGSFFDPERKMDEVRLEGDLTPVGPVPAVEEAVGRALDRRSDLRSLSAEESRLDLERRAARRRRIPEPVLTAGWKRTEAFGASDRGFVAAISVPVPLFDRGGPEAARAVAEISRVRLDAEILRRRVRAEVTAAVARERAARESAERYGPELVQRASGLRDIARLRYEEGESGILELLDAHRALLSIELSALAARHEARSARIERELVAGDEVRP